MNNKITTIDEGLRYLNEAGKECGDTFFSRSKTGFFKFILGGLGAAGYRLIRPGIRLNRHDRRAGGGAKKAVCPQEALRRAARMIHEHPWRSLALVTGVFCVIGMASAQYGARRKKART